MRILRNTKRAAMAGFAIWILLTGAALTGIWPLDWIELYLALAFMTVLPLGVTLIVRGEAEPARWPLRVVATVQPIAGLIAIASFAPSSGLVAAMLTLPWVATCGLMGLAGLMKILEAVQERATPRLPNLLDIAAMVYLPVGGMWLFASRAGLNPAGFEEPIVLLTAIHFHYTAFALPLWCGQLGRQDLKPVALRLFRVGAPGIILATPCIAAGFVFSPVLKLIAIFWLAGSIMLMIIAFGLSARSLPKRVAAGECVAALAICGGIVLAVIYGIGEFRNTQTISIARMAQMHGLLNGLCFSTVGLFGWTSQRSRID